VSEKLQQIIGSCLGLILIPVLIGLGISMQEKHDEKYPWRATFYINDSVKDDNNELKTLDECRAWANEKAEKMDLKEGEWDYECGRGCEYSDDSIEGGRRVKTYSCIEITK
jgi:hypothetical protein